MIDASEHNHTPINHANKLANHCPKGIRGLLMMLTLAYVPSDSLHPGCRRSHARSHLADHLCQSPEGMSKKSCEITSCRPFVSVTRGKATSHVYLNLQIVMSAETSSALNCFLPLKLDINKLCSKIHGQIALPICHSYVRVFTWLKMTT
jgi:hypothetical protein